MKKLLLLLLLLSFSFAGNTSYQGRYCEMDGAYTDSGDAVYGECYIY